MTVDRMEVWTPKPGNPVSLDDVRLWLVEMCRSYKAKLLYDPSQAYLMIEQIRKAGIRTEEFVFSSSSVGKLATAIGQALRGRTILLPNDEELRQELLAVRLRETSPNVMRIDTVGSGHDDRVIAVAMAIYDLTANAPNSAGREWLEELGRAAGTAAGSVPEGVQSPGASRSWSVSCNSSSNLLGAVSLSSDATSKKVLADRTTRPVLWDRSWLDRL